MSGSVTTLSTRLLPWLAPPLARLEAALNKGMLGHAWLIGGPAGVGKLNFALTLAHRLLSDAPVSAPLDAGTALAAMASRYEPTDRHPDLHWLHPEEDKATISVDQVRELIERFVLTAHRGRAKVALIEPAEALTTAAANSLLKTLEEPSSGGYLLLLSSQPGRLPATIRSRCQYLPLRPPDGGEVARWLGMAEPEVERVRQVVGSAPLKIGAALLGDEVNNFNKLESDLLGVCEDKVDPQSVAQAWAKGDTELALGWLRRRLYTELRSRAVEPQGSTEVTVRAGGTLHNAWRALPERTLFEQYDRAEKLLTQLGSGLNIELALQAMLNALAGNRGRS